jgi:putative ABC transport system permease protein
VTATLTLPDNKYGSDAKEAAFAARVCEKLAAIPSVTVAGVTQSLPFGGDYVQSLAIEGSNVAVADQPSANYYAVTPGYFKAMGVPLLHGRLFTERDSATAPLVTIVSESLARRFFPGKDPIGKRVNLQNAPGTWSEIVGVVGDVKQYGLDTDPPAEAYEPFDQHPFPFQTLVIRTSGSTGALAGNIRSAILAVDSEQPVSGIRPLTDLLKDSVSSQHFAMNLFMVFSGAALLLATVGIYGVMAYSVTQRTAEIGVRIALGAQRGDVLWMIARQGAVLIGVGIAGGLLGALLLTRFIATMLYGVGASDPLTLAGACIVLALAAFSACMLSAMRATRIDPTVALRAS